MEHLPQYKCTVAFTELRNNLLNSNYVQAITDEDTFDAARNKVHDILMMQFDRVRSIKKTIRKKDVKKPWITDRLKVYIKKRQRYYGLYRQILLSSNENIVFKKNYYSQLFQSYKYNTKKTWVTEITLSIQKPIRKKISIKK